MATSTIKTNNYTYSSNVSLNANVDIGYIDLNKKGNSVVAAFSSLRLASLLNSDSDVNIGTVPIGYRPVRDIYIPIPSISGGKNRFPLYLLVESNGNVSICNPVNGDPTLGYISTFVQWLTD